MKAVYGLSFFDMCRRIGRGHASKSRAAAVWMIALCAVTFTIPQSHAQEVTGGTALSRVDGPLDCRPEVAGTNRCLVALGAFEQPESAAVLDSNGEKLTRNYVRLNSSEARDFGYSEAVLVLYDLTSNDGRGRGRNLERTRNVATTVIGDLGGRTAVDLIVAGFADEVEILSEDSIAGATQQIDNQAFDGTSTFLFGSIVDALRILQNREASRKHVIVISDFVYEDKLVTLDDAIREANDQRITIDTLGLFIAADGSAKRSEGREAMKLLAEGTGGISEEIDLTTGETEGVSTFNRNFQDRRRQSGYIDIQGTYETAEVRLTVSQQIGTAGAGEVNYTAGIDPNCPADQTLAACETKRVNAEDPDEGGSVIAAPVSNRLFGLPVDDTYVIIGGVLLGLLLALLLYLFVRRRSDEDETDSDLTLSEDDGVPGFADNPAQGFVPAGGDETVQVARGAGGNDETVLTGGTPRGRLVPTNESAMPPFNLKSDRISIGRGDENDLIIRHESVSRNHAEIHADPRTGGLAITDLNSLNHVYVNGKRVQTEQLKDRDLVTLGRVEFRYEA